MRNGSFTVRLYDIEDRRHELRWPEGVDLPRWGEGFVWENDEFSVVDVCWLYEQGPGGTDVVYEIFLGPGTDKIIEQERGNVSWGLV